MDSENPEIDTPRARLTRAKEVKNDLNNLIPLDPDYSTKLAYLRDLLIKTRHEVTARGIFSANETIDDVATSDLALLQVDHYLGDLYTKAPTGSERLDPTAREQSLQHAQTYYHGFLVRLDQYELLSQDDEKLLERFSENKDGFELLTDRGTDASSRRALKIARYQARKQLDQKVKQRQAASPTNNTSDEETSRKAELAQLAMAVHDSFDALDLIAAERRLLKHARHDAPDRNMPAHYDSRELQSDRENNLSERLDSSSYSAAGGRWGPLLSPKGKPMQPFVLTGKRQQIRDGVFRSGHRLPTMSIDEYLEAERARGGIIEGGGEQSGQPATVDEDDMAAADREIEKQRAWDEFKENNPKGSGNTLNRG